MLDGIINMMPNAKIGHIGMYRDEETFKPNVYFFKVPKGIENREENKGAETEGDFDLADLVCDGDKDECQQVDLVLRLNAGLEGRIHVLVHGVTPLCKFFCNVSQHGHSIVRGVFKKGQMGLFREEVSNYNEKYNVRCLPGGRTIRK